MHIAGLSSTDPNSASREWQKIRAGGISLPLTFLFGQASSFGPNISSFWDLGSNPEFT